MSKTKWGDAVQPTINISIKLDFYYQIGALTHQNRSYRDSETKENVEAQKTKQRGGNDRKRTVTTKNKHN